MALRPQVSASRHRTLARSEGVERSRLATPPASSQGGERASRAGRFLGERTAKTVPSGSTPVLTRPPCRPPPAQLGDQAVPQFVQDPIDGVRLPRHAGLAQRRLVRAEDRHVVHESDRPVLRSVLPLQPPSPDLQMHDRGRQGSDGNGCRRPSGPTTTRSGESGHAAVEAHEGELSPIARPQLPRRRQVSERRSCNQGAGSVGRLKRPAGAARGPAHTATMAELRRYASWGPSPNFAVQSWTPADGQLRSTLTAVGTGAKLRRTVGGRRSTLPALGARQRINRPRTEPPARGGRPGRRSSGPGGSTGSVSPRPPARSHTR